MGRVYQSAADVFAGSLPAGQQLVCHRLESVRSAQQAHLYEPFFHHFSFRPLEPVERLAQVVVADAQAGDGAFQAFERVPPERRYNPQAIEFEADLVARTIRHWLDARLTIPWTHGAVDNGGQRRPPGEVVPVPPVERRTLASFGLRRDRTTLTGRGSRHGR